MPRKVSLCPPGIWCITPTLGVIVLVGVCIIAYYIFFQTNMLHSYTKHYQHHQNHQQHQQPQQPIHVSTNVSMRPGDDRYTRSPEPLRFWQTAPDLRGALLPPGAVPINVSTRGLPQAYQQMGILKTGEQILPLYGRQTAYRSDRYNYYTRTDSYNPIQLPIKYEKRDCMDTIGCGELMGGEHIKISGLGKDAHVEVYNFDGPTYIPGLV